MCLQLLYPHLLRLHKGIPVQAALGVLQHRTGSREIGGTADSESGTGGRDTGQGGLEQRTGQRQSRLARSVPGKALRRPNDREESAVRGGDVIAQVGAVLQGTQQSLQQTALLLSQPRPFERMYRMRIPHRVTHPRTLLTC
ncbi:hypothetical protein [Streptomyces sp. GMR22]|uniref:hypothetical protein n=1 Tax=Streptomyces sp. GMR22 TaxID=2759524 RepID=UPI0015F7F679|nr:hypothetical protein [Streptomyces sp. GMR22]MBA6436587.1 hypothetical protein [Streptomyces sp. GMR22]